MNKKLIKIIGILTFVIATGFAVAMLLRNTQQPPTGLGENQGGLEEKLHPLSIESG